MRFLTLIHMNMRFAFALAFILINSFAFLSPATAQHVDLFSVRQPVDATADSAAKAQEKAISEGRVKAAETIMRRMALKEV